MNLAIIKIFVTGFYRSNAGLFTLGILFMFGMLRTYEHLQMAVFFLSSYPSLLIPFIFWTLYNMNVLYFYHRTVSLPENYFIVYSSLAPEARQFNIAGKVQVLIFLPVILYILFLSGIAVMNALWVKFFIIVFILACLVIFNMIYFKYLVSKRHNIFRSEIKSLPRSRHWRLPFIFHFYDHAFRTDPVRILLTKGFSLVVLFTFFGLFQSGDYKFSLVTLAVLLSAAIHGIMVFSMHDFYENKYSFTRNLPLGLLRKSVLDFNILFILILPELIIIIMDSYIIGIARCIELSALLISILYLLKSMLLVWPADTEAFMKWIVYGFILFTLLFLYQPPLFILIPVLWIISIWIYRKYYYRYEPVIHTPEAG